MVGLNFALHQQFLGRGDGLGRIKALRANIGAIHDRVAAIEFERVFKLIEAFTGGFIATIDNPALGV